MGERIRALLLDPASRDMDRIAELLLYMADRAQHLKEVIRPCLADGQTVLCDRYFDATVAYQGYARGLDVEMIEKLHALLFEDLKPQITFLLDLPPRAGLARAWRQLETGTRDGSESRFEKETLAFHEKVREGYLELARREPGRIHVIDAGQGVKQVQIDMQEVLRRCGVDKAVRTPEK